MAATSSEHSRMGVASFVLSFLPGVLLVGAYWLVLFLVSKQPAGADTVAYGFGLIMLSLLIALSEIVALGLGVAGTLQRQRKRTFALVGVVCSVLVLAWINSEVELGRLVLVLPELFDLPEIHYSKTPPEG